MKRFVALAALVLLSFAGAASAEPNVEELGRVKDKMVAIKQLHDEGLVDRQAFDVAMATLKVEASVAAEEDVESLEQVEAILARGSFSSYLTLANIILFLAGILLAVAVGWLVVIYFWPILSHMPIVAWEALAYLLLFAGLSSGLLFKPLSVWIAVPSAMLLPIMFYLTFLTHFAELSKNRSDLFEAANQAVSLLSALVFAGFALAYPSSILGFFSVVGLFAALGFVAVPFMPLGYAVGFRKDNQISRSTLVAGLFAAAYLAMHATGQTGYPFSPFATGAFYFGPICFCLGLLILSSWYFDGRSENRLQNYIGSNIMAAILMGGLVVAGVLTGVQSVVGIGCTFFCLFLVEKYFEIPWGKIGFAWACLCLAGLLYAIGWFIMHNPSLFALIKQ